MIKNYLKTAIRNLLRYKGFSIINIASLTFGIVGCLIIGLFVWDEKKYDKNIPDGDRIYRIYEEYNNNNIVTYGASVPPAYANFLPRQYPEVETSTKMLMTGDRFLMERGEKKGYETGGRLVDSNFFQVFPLDFIKGNAKALYTPMSIVLSQELAQKYFGQDDPIGKTVFIDKDTFEVKGVYSKLPDHFHMKFNYLMPISSAGFPEERMQSWGWHQFFTYVKVKPGINIDGLQQKFQSHVKKEILPREEQSGSTYLPFFQALQDIHLQSADFAFDHAIRGNETYVRALSIIALFVLLIACFNFINLATARSFRRAKEIGVRKVVGADRKQLIIQFLGETVLLSMIAMLIAIISTVFLVPVLNEFTGKSIEFNPLSNPLLALVMIVAAILVGLIAGIYPALILSGFQPIRVLKNMKIQGNSSWLRPALVIIQFSLSVLLIVCTLIVYRQTEYMNNKDLGFSKERVMYFQIRSEDAIAKVEALKTELRKTKGVLSVTSGYGLPGDAYAGDGVKVQTREGEKDYSSKVFIGDHDYVKTLGLKVIAGRDFSRDMKRDEQEGFLINRAAIQKFGFESPEKAIGQPLAWNEWVPADTSNPVKRGRVIGVVEDFHYESLHEKVTASVIQLYPAVTSTIAAKLDESNISSTVESMKRIWDQFSPGYPFDYKFMDESYGIMYNSEEKLSQLLWIFAIMAILVGCMGLFGLAAFSAEQRKKEIGIRKVLGASMVNIMSILSRNFLLMVIISALIAFPVAWFAMSAWLEDFPYRVEISWWIFVAALVIALLIAFITVSFQSIKAATMNPVKSLRTE